MLRELRGAITALALVVCGVLVLVSFDVGIPGQALLQSLRFHIVAGLLGLLMLLFTTGAWWRGLLFLIVFAASVAQGGLILYNQQQVRITAAAQGAKPLLKLLSFNLLNTNPNGKQIADYIIASGADVVMLMEAAPLESQRDRLLAVYPYFAGCDGPPTCETVLISKTPLTNISVGSLSAVWRNRLVTAATTIGGTKINLVLVHLVKPYFDEFPDEEIYRLSQAVERLEGPVLLAGDFNAAAWSRNVDRLVVWEDLAPGPSYPATWPVRLGPLGVPIDNVFARAPLVIDKVEAMEDAMGSNHRGLIAEVGVVSGG